MTLTVAKIAEQVRPPERVYLVVQRANGHWSPGAKIIAVSPLEHVAEQMAAAEKAKHPQQHFGVAVLRAEARHVTNPIEIVKVED